MKWVDVWNDEGLPIAQIAAISGKTEDEVRAIVAQQSR
jgi:hypothetical protein